MIEKDRTALLAEIERLNRHYTRVVDDNKRLTEVCDNYVLQQTQLRAALERLERCKHLDPVTQKECGHCHACMHTKGHADDCWWDNALKGYHE